MKWVWNYEWWVYVLFPVTFPVIVVAKIDEWIDKDIENIRDGKKKG